MVVATFLRYLALAQDTNNCQTCFLSALLTVPYSVLTLNHPLQFTKTPHANDDLPKKLRTDSKAYIQLTTISGTFNDQLGAYERTV